MITRYSVIDKFNSFIQSISGKIVCLVFVFIFFNNIAAYADGISDPGSGGTTDETDPDGTVPIDGGISLIVAAGIGYGAKKLKDRKTTVKHN